MVNEAMVGKPPKPGKYLCMRCESEFAFDKGALRCPKCSNTTRNDLVPVFVRDVLEEELMHTADDFPGG